MSDVNGRAVSYRGDKFEHWTNAYTGYRVAVVAFTFWRTRSISMVEVDSLVGALPGFSLEEDNLVVDHSHDKPFASSNLLGVMTWASGNGGDYSAEVYSPTGPIPQSGLVGFRGYVADDIRVRRLRLSEVAGRAATVQRSPEGLRLL